MARRSRRSARFANAAIGFLVLAFAPSADIVPPADLHDLLTGRA